MFDATIAVIADEQTREARAAARGHEALAERGARQLTQEEKSQRATYTVHNDAIPPSWRPSCRRSLTCCCDESTHGHGHAPHRRRHGDGAPAAGRAPAPASVLGIAAAIVALVVATMVLPLAKRVVNDLSLPLSIRT